MKYAFWLGYQDSWFWSKWGWTLCVQEDEMKHDSVLNLIRWWHYTN